MSRPLSYRQRGISAIEVLMVMAVIGIISAGAIFYFNGNNARSTSLLNTAQEYANAMTRAKADMSCYPDRMDALFIRASASTSFCGLDLTTQWKGRYTAVASVNAAGNVLLDTISPGAILSIAQNVDAVGTHWLINVDNVPNEVITRATETCNGGAAAAGKCVGTPGAAGTGTFTLEFDLT